MRCRDFCHKKKKGVCGELVKESDVKQWKSLWKL